MRRRRTANWAILVVLAAVVFLGTQLVLWGTSASESSPRTGNASSSALPTGQSAAQLLETLPVKGRAPRTGYNRVEQFGTAWADVDHNGCDTRNDVLARDLRSITRQGRCTVVSGTLVSSYSGRTLSFTRGPNTSAAVQIDHVVPLLDAWQTGAQRLGREQRIALANDPLNLQAVEGALNEQKSASDAASWLPPSRTYWCTYVARQISVKAAYGLWTTPAEHDRMAQVLSACPGQRAFVDDGVR